MFPFFTRKSKKPTLLSFDIMNFNVFESEYNKFFSEHCVENITIPLHNRQHEKDKPRIIFVHPYGISPMYAFMKLKTKMLGSNGTIMFLKRTMKSREIKKLDLTIQTLSNSNIRNALNARKNIVLCPDEYNSIVGNNRQYTRVFTSTYGMWFQKAIQSNYDIDIVISPNVNNIIVGNSSNEMFQISRYLLSYFSLWQERYNIQPLDEELELHYFQVQLPDIRHAPRQVTNMYCRDIIHTLREYSKNNLISTIII